MARVIKDTKRMKAKIKKDDEVIVITGKDKGKTGKVLEVKFFNDGRVKVLVEGVNIAKKAVKPNPQVGESGGIKEREAFLDISNVKLFNSAANKGDRVGYRFLKDGKKARYFKSTDEIVDVDNG